MAIWYIKKQENHTCEKWRELNRYEEIKRLYIRARCCFLRVFIMNKIIIWFIIVALLFAVWDFPFLLLGFQ